MNSEMVKASNSQNSPTQRKAQVMRFQANPRHRLRERIRKTNMPEWLELLTFLSLKKKKGINLKSSSNHTENIFPDLKPQVELLRAKHCKKDEILHTVLAQEIITRINKKLKLLMPAKSSIS